MSLKDRLNTQIKTDKTANNTIDEQPDYYRTSEIANTIDSLGVLDNLLCDDDINHIFVNGAKNIYIDKNSKIYKSTATFRDNVQLENLIKKYAQNAGFEFNTSNPVFKFNHQKGVNVVACIPPFSNNVSLFIKCYRDKFATLQTLQEETSVSKEIALVLEALCSIKNNILIIGEKNTLKTTLLSALAKKIPPNNRGIVIDNNCEIKIDSSNILNFDFTLFNNNEQKNTLIDSIYAANPDKIFINNPEDELIYKIMDNYNTTSGNIITLEAKNPESAFEKLCDIIIKNKKTQKDSAEKIIKDFFDVIITVKKTDTGKRKILSISQIKKDPAKLEVETIFYFNHLAEHESCGVIPDFYENIKSNSLPISVNIFEADYKHTYSKKTSEEIISQFNKKANIDILKKFKKDLSSLPQDNQSSADEDTTHHKEEDINKEELDKLAQQKFEEITKNYIEENRTPENDENV